MKNLLKKILHPLHLQNELFRNNYKEIDESNLKMLKLVLIVGCIFFGTYLVISLVAEEYYGITSAYIAVLVLLLIILMLYKKIHAFMTAAQMLYLVHIIVILFSLYVSGIMAPEYPSITVLLFIFQIPIVILDKSWKVNAYELAYIGAFLIFIIPLKEESLVFDEYLNCFLFASLAMVFGEYFRKSKIENFELKRQALIREKKDILTNLENRRSMFSHLTEIKERKETTNSIGIFMIDIDHFKLYNDTYGHQAGDECLRTIGNCFLEFGRKNNMKFYRYGGEEFVGIAENTNSEQLSDLGKELNQKVFNLKIPHQQIEQAYVSISIGLSFCDDSKNIELNRLITQADIALYSAKANGRNNIAFYTKDLDDSALSKHLAPSFRQQ